MDASVSAATSGPHRQPTDAGADAMPPIDDAEPRRQVDLKTFGRQFVVPASKALGRRARGKLTGRLFEGDDGLFTEAIAGAEVYAEYGCGQSTRWVLEHTAATVYAVDTSEDWVAHVRQSDPTGERLHVHWVDVGPLGSWGTPTGFTKRENFAAYTDWAWDQGVSPDVVLVDGRFRVASFLTSLRRAEPGTTILFDDYRDRPQYHLVEEFVPVADRCGRQVRFEVPTPGRLDLDAIDALIAQFRLVVA